MNLQRMPLTPWGRQTEHVACVERTRFPQPVARGRGLFEAILSNRITFGLLCALGGAAGTALGLALIQTLTF